VFFGNVAIGLVDFSADGRHAVMDFDSDPFRGPGAPAANCGSEELTIAPPIPGCGGKGIWDGKANPMIVFRLFLDASEHLH
jgi:hypothetical protein